MLKPTEQNGPDDHLEQRSTLELVTRMNAQDQSVAPAVQKSLPQIAALVDAAADRVAKGGRLFYLGSGTSGRLGILDASECPPTFGVSPDVVVGLIAGGDGAIRNAVEGAEDDPQQAWRDLLPYRPGPIDTVVGLSASGTTPYVLGAVEAARRNGLLTGCVTCNPATPLAKAVECPVEVTTGPEFITGSTRLKAGTAQKMVLNMLTTSVMIRLGRVQGNRMVDMQLANAKLIDRGARYVAEASGLPYAEARELLLKQGSVRRALEAASNRGL